jgi:hypothetical protein
MTSGDNEREDVDDASSRAWRVTLDRTRTERQQRSEQYQPRHRRERDKGELRGCGSGVDAVAAEDLPSSGLYLGSGRRAECGEGLAAGGCRL